ncbi:MAG: tRNA uridine(34) 5-carboxymethylaminomethyl modification radical SAM/GNAT enzyme Elp3 [Patescibacteria group bacterium]|jgi:elongator complex protein 3
MAEAIKKLIIENFNILENRDQLEDVKRAYCRQFKLDTILNSDIFKTYRLLLAAKTIKRSERFENLLRKRSVRTLSGIAPVAVLTKSYPCPGTCAYCPRQEDVPVSYLSNEPAVMRAIRCQYDPYKQVVLRLKALENNGHEPEKIEIIVIGGTWSYLPQKYKYWYIANCFRAANDYPRLRLKKLSNAKEGDSFKININSFYKQNLSLANLKTALLREQQKNENAKYRIIGLTLETRPDYINEPELREMRTFGCTRVEMGVQALDNRILTLNKRGHGIEEVAEATKLLKEYGFKITYHIMPALPGSTPAKDLKMFKMLFSDERFQPDQIKFYPTVVTKGSLLYEWYRQGKYKPYSDKALQELIVKCKAAVPEYVRIIRLIRDIPGESIVAGNKITNLRQVMQQRGVKCNCIRCREVKDGHIISPKINIIEYPASSGREFFLSADSADHKTLYGFCRLRLDVNSPIAPAIIRELHVYGKLVSVGGDKKVQHSGLGKQLLAAAEEIVKTNNLAKIAVISGVGVRGYYKKFGYKLKNTYLFKSFDKRPLLD